MPADQDNAQIEQPQKQLLTLRGALGLLLWRMWLAGASLASLLAACIPRLCI
jgi:hypothetical protein